MYSALYYPNIQIQRTDLLKTALLLWDRLEFITPFPEWGQHADDRSVQEALELITRPHVPSQEEKRLAHQGILELATSDLPRDFLLEPSDFETRYRIYPQKFLPESWDALRETKLAEPHRGRFDEWAMSSSLGLAMMSILAEACAGSELRTVTDEVSSFKLLAKSITDLHGGAFGPVGDDVERLVTISLKIVDASRISLKRLVDFRKSEEAKAGASIRLLRHNYLKQIDSFVTRLASVRDHQASRKEIERQFKQEMRDDLANLREALKQKRTDAVFSKDVGVAVIAAAGMAIPPLTVPATLLAVGALIQKASNYRAERKAMLGKHAMAWLFEMKAGWIKPY
jgi:hypothetical protein